MWSDLPLSRRQRTRQADDPVREVGRSTHLTDHRVGPPYRRWHRAFAAHRPATTRSRAAPRRWRSADPAPGRAHHHAARPQRAGQHSQHGTAEVQSPVARSSRGDRPPSSPPRPPCPAVRPRQDSTPPRWGSVTSVTRGRLGTLGGRRLLSPRRWDRLQLVGSEVAADAKAARAERVSRLASR